MIRPVPPLPDDGDIGWSGLIRAAFTSLTSWINGKAESVHSHIVTNVTGLRQELDSKAGVNHTHNLSEVNHTHQIGDVSLLQSTLTGITDRMSALETLTNLLSANLNSVSVSATVTNAISGIRILCNTTPNIFVGNWQVVILRANIEIFKANFSTNNIYISHVQGNFSNGNALVIQVTAHSANSSKSSNLISHSYQGFASEIDERILELTNRLNSFTVSNLVEAICEDGKASTVIADALSKNVTFTGNVAFLKR